MPKTQTQTKAAPKPPEAVIDATDCVLGRLGTTLAKRLLNGERIHVVNAERAVVVGSVDSIKARYQFKIEVGTERKGPFHPRMPHLILKRTVRGMLPYQLPRGRDALKRLTCHIGVPDELKRTTPEVLGAVQKPNRPGMTLAQISQFLGKHVEVGA